MQQLAAHARARAAAHADVRGHRVEHGPDAVDGAGVGGPDLAHGGRVIKC